MVKPYERQFQRISTDAGWIFTTMRMGPGPKMSLCPLACETIWPAIKNSVRIRVRVSSRNFKGSKCFVIWSREWCRYLWSTKDRGHQQSGGFMPDMNRFLVRAYYAGLKKKNNQTLHVCMTPVE